MANGRVLSFSTVQRSQGEHPRTAGMVKDITSNEWGYLGVVKVTPEVDVNAVFALIEASYKSTL